MTRRHRFALIGTVLSCVLLSTSRSALAQGLPADWQSLPADAFADVAATALTSTPPPSDELLKELTNHAWTFLGNADFIATGNWNTVTKLSGLFGNKWQLLSDATPGQEPPRVAAYRDALKARLANQSPTTQQFAELLAADTALEQGGLSRADLTPRVVQWMEANDWKQLALPERIRLSNLLHVEQLPVARFSVRWTGFLTAPVSGDYVFEQARQHHIDGALRLRLGNSTVLDSTRDAVATNDNAPRYQVRSKPVTLEAGERVSIAVEYVYDAESMLQSREFDERIFPMVLVTWQRGNGPAEIIPPSAFTAANGTSQGLLGEYFASVDFGQRVLSRIDPGLQMIWSEKQVASAFAEEQAEVVNTCLEAINAPNALTSIEDKQLFIEGDLPKLLKRLPALERAALLRQLSAQPELLQAATPFGVRSLFPHLFMLSPDVTTDFFLAWVNFREVDANQILPYPGWGPGTFLAYAYDDYGWVGHFLRGANWPIADRLLKERLENEDGTCNLMVAYCVTMAAVADGRGDWMQRLLDQRLEDDTLTGDRRVSWLLARAFFEEMSAAGIPRPIRGMPYLDEAALVVESPELRFRIVQETVARLASLDQAERALQHLEGAEAAHANHTAEIASWRLKINQLSEHYENVRAASPKAVAPIHRIRPRKLSRR